MYETYVKDLMPKPKLNLTWYEGEDRYSDGDVEDIIAKIVAENEPEDYVTAVGQYFNWATYVHLTPIRRNILNWYPFKNGASVLEIGCGMGALTGVLCDACESVTSVEMSLRRATVTQLRCREYENLEIIVGNLNDIQFEKKFDYITLIGVLEYQGTYTDSENPYLDFVIKLKSLLKPDGKLLIAIENQYGLKYWCGATEDHTGLPFDGINGYESERKVRTFSRNGLENLVKEAGFVNSFFYYPMPDYKLPRTVFSDKYLPTQAKFSDMMPYATNASYMILSEDKLYKDIIDNGVFNFFANSFLVECSDSECADRPVFARMPVNRLPEYQIGVKIRANGLVERYALNKMAVNHIDTILLNEEMLEKTGIHIIRNKREEHNIVSEVCKDPLLEEVIVKAIRNRDRARILSILDEVRNDIERTSELTDWQENILYKVGIERHKDPEIQGKILKNGYIDMTFSNAFYSDKGLTWFDQEWRMENVPVNFIFYRAIGELYASHPELTQYVSPVVLYKHLGMTRCLDDYAQLDNMFATSVTDMASLNERRQFEFDAQEISRRNIELLMRK